MRDWGTTWPAGLLVGIVMVAIVDAILRAVSLRK